MNQQYPVVVIGAGPIGLAAAAHLVERGQAVRVLEAGATAGAAMREWGHIKLFSTWQYNIDSAARRLLETPSERYSPSWRAPRATRLPTGAELVAEYLEPLAAHPSLAAVINYRHRVLSVTRVDRDGHGCDKTRTEARAQTLFLVRTENEAETIDILARAVIDASGTWRSPNPIGRSGIAAIGEREARDAHRITSPLPDPLGADLESFAGKRVIVLGAGHSAANTLISLGRLRQKYPATEIFWGLRGKVNPIRLYGGGAADELPGRGQLGTSLRRLVEQQQLTLIEDVSVSSIEHAEALTIRLADGRQLEVDIVVPATGFRPDLSMLSELRLDLDQVVEAPRVLGPLIDPASHSCGTVAAHGERELSHPEVGFYIVGMKSYGRAPTFLMATGYEQVRSVAAALAGDRSAAETVQLKLPETGVCSTKAESSSDLPESVEVSARRGTTEPAAESCCTPNSAATLGFATGTLHGHAELVAPEDTSSGECRS